MSTPAFHAPGSRTLRFSVQLFQDQNPDKLEEMIARMRDPTMARNAYGEAVSTLARQADDALADAS